MESVFDKWIAADSTAPLPYLAMTSVYIKHDTKLKRARALTTIALDLIQRDTAGTWNGKRAVNPYEKNVYYFYTIFDYKDGHYTAALTNIDKAMRLSGANVGKEMYFRRGEIYAAMGSIPQAKHNYFLAYMNGKPEAGDSLRALVGGGDFVQQLRALAEKNCTSAPEVTGTDLHGRHIKLSNYRGKVAVLTFWFVGCGGCMIEEESLARLAKEIDTSRAVLIGLARDEKSRVDDYLSGKLTKGKKHDFYDIQIAAAAAPIKAYHVQAFPTHIIIDRYGHITARVVGGSSRSGEELMTMIAAAGAY